MTTDNIKILLQTINLYASELNEEEVTEIMEPLAKIAVKIAKEKENNIKRTFTEAGEGIERVRIKLYTNSCKEEFRKLVKVR